ncbi:chymotrypsin-elastase inhibitor ixodidin-like [Haemaphysalis longicornis]
MKVQVLTVAAAVLLAAAVLCDAQAVVPVRGLPNGSRCGPGEVLKYCQSSTCGERTCASPGPPTHCTADCRTSCFCEDGFFRNRAKRCVPLALCS